MSTTPVTAEDIDLAMVFYREEGRWTAAALPARSASGLDLLLDALRRFPGEGGVFGAVAVADEFFIVVRETANGRQAALSDGACALDWSLAEELVDLLGIADENPEEYEPVGDLNLFADFNLTSGDFIDICQADDLYPEEQLAAIAERIGCGPAWSQALKDSR